MQVFKAFFKVLSKSLKGILIYFIIYIALTIALTASNTQEGNQNFTQTSLKFMAENQDEGPLGDALISYLKQHNECMELPESEEMLLDAMYNRKVNYVLYIPKDFTQRFEAGERDGLLKNSKVPSSAQGTLMDTQIEQYMVTLGRYLDSGFTLEESITHTSKDMKIEASVELLDKSKAEDDVSASYYFRYLAYILTTVVIAGLGSTLMAFRKKDIMDRSNCSTMSFTKRSLQVILGCGLAVLVCLGIFLAVAFILFRDYMLSARGILSMVNALLFILFTLSLAFLCSQIVKSLNAITMLSNVVGLGMAFLGGIFVPKEVFSDTVLNIAKFVPTYWYSEVNDLIQGATGVFSAPQMVYVGYAVQIGFTVMVLCVGLMLGRMKVRQV